MSKACDLNLKKDDVISDGNKAWIICNDRQGLYAKHGANWVYLQQLPNTNWQILSPAVEYEEITLEEVKAGDRLEIVDPSGEQWNAYVRGRFVYWSVAHHAIDREADPNLISRIFRVKNMPAPPAAKVESLDPAERVRIAFERLIDEGRRIGINDLSKLQAEILEIVEPAAHMDKPTAEESEDAAAAASAAYGYCPVCGVRGINRERRPNGNDKCYNGHTYPTANARKHPGDAASLLSGEPSQ